MIENQVENIIPLFPADISELQEGLQYIVSNSPLIKLTHCTGLNCVTNGPFGTLGRLDKNPVVTPDNYDSISFIPAAGTVLRVVASVQASDRCNNCMTNGGVCVTLGGRDANEVYNLSYEELRPKFVNRIGNIPIGAKVRTIGKTFGASEYSDYRRGITYTIKEGTDCELDLDEQGRILKISNDARYLGGMDLLPPPNTLLEVLEVPEIAKLWATCWEITNRKGSRKVLSQSLRSIGERLLSKFK
ncbi:hypothetical protein KC675_02890 [Candidatus Dojkabacteria bacterium]|jgi:hypothetical protein|uniref:Uncharacterized protein n=1 Tax=Candidatus Dojkabacteria bacterium TaxID=2099670 RepID=A0A955L0F1_9BACT|nr:hypothetical protein [Candidatus Dojkabacteria bacterium]